MFGVFLLGGMEILFILFCIPLGLALMAFWIWMLIDAAQNRGLDQNEKIVWIVVIALLHWLGALLYLIIARPKRNLVAGLPPTYQ